MVMRKKKINFNLHGWHILIFMLLTLSTKLYSQIITDNLYSFGFKNVFNWNVVILDKEIDGNVVRMLMFENIKTVKNRFISCDLQQKKDRVLSSFADPTFNSIDSVSNSNSNSKEKTLLYTINNKKGAFALIEHYGYVLRLTYFDSHGVDLVKFRELVSSYSYIKIDL